MGTLPIVFILLAMPPLKFSDNARNTRPGPMVINKYNSEGGYFVTFKNEKKVYNAEPVLSI